MLPLNAIFSNVECPRGYVSKSPSRRGESTRTTSTWTRRRLHEPLFVGPRRWRTPYVLKTTAHAFFGTKQPRMLQRPPLPLGAEIVALLFPDRAVAVFDLASILYARGNTEKSSARCASTRRIGAMAACSSSSVVEWLETQGGGGGEEGDREQFLQTRECWVVHVRAESFRVVPYTNIGCCVCVSVFFFREGEGSIWSRTGTTVLLLSSLVLLPCGFDARSGCCVALRTHASISTRRGARSTAGAQ